MADKRKKYYNYLIRPIYLFILFLYVFVPSGYAESENSFSDFLPIGKEWLSKEDRDSLLPLPIGIDMNFYTHRQELTLEKISISTTSSALAGIVNGIILNTSSIDSEVFAYTTSLDVWLFPFVNIYVVGGYADGQSSINIKSFSHIAMTDAALQTILTANGIPSSFVFEIDYEGRILGGGMTFAGGINGFFGSLDVNYTYTELDIANSEIKTINISPRFGMRGNIGPIDGKIWLGGMYQGTTEHIRGNTDLLGVKVNFDVIQEAKEPWNFIVGFQWDLTRAWHITMDVGLGHRNSFYVSGEFRF